MKRGSYKSSIAYKCLVDKNQQLLLDKPGIYKIGFIGTEKFYIGSTTESLTLRFIRHYNSLKRGTHHNAPLQHAFKKYKEKITLEILEVCEKSECIKREQYYLDTLFPEYNICKVAGNTFGVVPSRNERMKRGKPVYMYDLEGNFIKQFPNGSFASEEIGVHSSCIFQSIVSGGKTGSYMFKNTYKGEKIDKYVDSTCKPILCYTKQGEFVQEFDSILGAGKHLNIHAGNISKHLSKETSNCCGYIFKYYQDNYPLKINPQPRVHKNQKKVIVTDLETDEIFEFESIRQIPFYICNRTTINFFRKKKGDEFVIKKKFKIQLITCKNNDLTKTN